MAGRIEIADPLYRYGFHVFNGQGYVPKSYGMGIFLVPFAILGWKAAFISGLMVHILSTFLFYKLLIRFGWNPDNVLLYLFFPYFFYYSTTLFPDFHSAFFVLAGFYLYTSGKNKHQILSGTIFGIAWLIKITNILAFIPFIFISFLKDRAKFWRILMGFIPPAILILTLNHVYYGGIFKIGHLLLEQGVPIETRFSPSFYQYYIPFIAFRLMAVYPLMLLAPLFYKGKGRAEILLAVVIFFAFFATRNQSGWGFNLEPSTLTRYFLPIMPLLLLTYIPFYEKIVERLNLPRRAVLYSVALILISGGIFIFDVQKERLEIQAAVSEEIYVNTEHNALIISESDVLRYIMEPFGDRRFLESNTPDAHTYFDDNTYVVHRRFERPSPAEEELGKWTEEVVRYSNATLVKEIEYKTTTRFFASRPFTLEIYKVPHT